MTPKTHAFAQKLFDIGFTGIVKQGSPSLYDNFGACAYRGLGGRACAIGKMIPYRLYQKNIEDTSVDDPGVLRILRKAFPDNASAFRSPGLRAFLVDLQKAHDLAVADGRDNFLAAFIKRATKVAAEYNLTVPEVTP